MEEKKGPSLSDFQRRNIRDCLVSLSAVEMHADIKPNTTHSLSALKSQRGFSHFYTFTGCGGKNQACTAGAVLKAECVSVHIFFSEKTFILSCSG